MDQTPPPPAPESGAERRRRGLVIGASLAAAVVAVGVAVGTSADSTRDVGDYGDLAQFYSQEIDWGPCTDYAAGGNRINYGLQCARVEVPIDYADPDGDTAEIAISRSRATTSSPASMR